MAQPLPGKFVRQNSISVTAPVQRPLSLYGDATIPFEELRQYSKYAVTIFEDEAKTRVKKFQTRPLVDEKVRILHVYDDGFYIPGQRVTLEFLELGTSDPYDSSFNKLEFRSLSDKPDYVTFGSGKRRKSRKLKKRMRKTRRNK